jgi:hypothetical protein
MAIRFNCSCGREMNVKDSLAGKKGKCPACGQIVEVPASSEPEPVPLEVEKKVEAAPPPAPTVETKPCRHCKKLIPVDAVFCTSCGTHLRTGKKHQPKGDAETADYNFLRTAPDLLTKPMEAVGVIVEAPLATANLRKALILLAIGMFFFTWVVPLNNEEAINIGVLHNGGRNVWNPELALPLTLVLGLLSIAIDAIICNLGGTMFGTTGAEISSVFMAVVAVRAILGLVLIPFWIYCIVPGLPAAAYILEWGPRAVRILYGTFLMYCVMMRSYDCGVVPALVFAASTTIAQALLFWLPGLILGFFNIRVSLI